MQDIQLIIKEDLLSAILLIGGSLYIVILCLILLYHTFTLLFKR